MDEVIQQHPIEGEVCVNVLLGDRVYTGFHHRQAFTAFYIVWKLLNTC